MKTSGAVLLAVFYFVTWQTGRCVDPVGTFYVYTDGRHQEEVTPAKRIELILQDPEKKIMFFKSRSSAKSFKDGYGEFTCPPEMFRVESVSEEKKQ